MLSVQYPEIPGGRGDRASSSGLTSQGRKECAGNGHSAAWAGQWIFGELAIRVVRNDRAGGGQADLTCPSDGAAAPAPDSNWRWR